MSLWPVSKPFKIVIRIFMCANLLDSRLEVELLSRYTIVRYR